MTTDRPTDRQDSFENMRMVSKCAFTMSKQTCAKQVQVFPPTTYGLGTFGRSQKPTPPLDRKVPVNQSPVLLLVSRKGAQTEFCAWCPQSASGARAVLKTLQKKLSKPSWACEFTEASELPKQRVRRLAGSVG